MALKRSKIHCFCKKKKKHTHAIDLPIGHWIMLTCLISTLNTNLNLNVAIKHFLHALKIP